MKKIIPCLDIKGGKVVKGIKFEDVKDLGDPYEFALKYEREGADELVFLNITSLPEELEKNFQVIEKIAKEIKIPLTVGGGIKSVKSAKKLLNLGVSKISIGTAGIKNPMLIDELVKELGGDKVVIAVDCFKNPNGEYEVLISGGREKTGTNLMRWLVDVEKKGVCEILLTSKDADGTKDGYDIELYKKVKDVISIPVTASGGCGKMEDILKVLTDGKADAALAASVFHYGDFTSEEVKKYLEKRD